MWDHTPVELFFKGGECMWPLLAFSILGLAVILDRTAALIYCHASYVSFAAQWEAPIRAGRLADVLQRLAAQRSPIAKVTAAYLTYWNSPQDLRDDVVARQASQQIAKLEKRMSWLGMIASVATLLGLLGTVTGLVTAFHQIEVKQGMVQPGDLAAGIWEALITTVFGLMIAIPCMAVYHLLDSRAGATALELQWIKSNLDEWRQTGAGSDDDRLPRRSELESAAPGRR